MSRFCGTDSADAILDAATRWRDTALVSDGSEFGERALWSSSNLDVLDTAFIQHPDEGEGRYLERLERQLAPGDAAVKQLAAEINWLMLLCPRNIGASLKRQQLQTIWSWSGERDG